MTSTHSSYCDDFFIRISFCLFVCLLNYFFWHEDLAKTESDLSDDHESNDSHSVIEYEVDDCSPSEDIESHDSSSGTDVRNNHIVLYLFGVGEMVSGLVLFVKRLRLVSIDSVIFCSHIFLYVGEFTRTND